MVACIILLYFTDLRLCGGYIFENYHLVNFVVTNSWLHKKTLTEGLQYSLKYDTSVACYILFCCFGHCFVGNGLYEEPFVG